MATIPERLATLEAQQQDLSTDLTTVVATTASIEKTLNELIGAKKAIIIITGLFATVTSIVVGWFNINRGN